RHVSRVDRLGVLQPVVVDDLRLRDTGYPLLAFPHPRDFLLRRAARVAAPADLAFGERIDRHGVAPIAVTLGDAIRFPFAHSRGGTSGGMTRAFFRASEGRCKHEHSAVPDFPFRCSPSAAARSAD